MDKSANVDQYRRGIQWLHDHGILTFASFIVGFPGETDATVDETLNFILETEPDFYRTQMWYNEPGTPIHAQREKYAITGEGFVWTHATMESLEAMDHIDRIFLTVEDSIWLPQWSYDFWIIPYLYGKGITPDQLRSFTSEARKLMALGIASVPAEEKAQRREASLRNLTGLAGNWALSY
jgi:p-methyltransferase